MTKVVRPCRRDLSPSWINASLSLSRLEVASSSTRARAGSARIARAIATRWRWPPDSFTPALADNRVVLLLEPLDELVGVGDAAHPLDLLERRIGPSVADVVGDGAVEQEVVLQDDAQLRAVVAQPYRLEISSIDQDPAALAAD